MEAYRISHGNILPKVPRGMIGTKKGGKRPPQKEVAQGQNCEITDEGDGSVQKEESSNEADAEEVGRSGKRQKRMSIKDSG